MATGTGAVGADITALEALAAQFRAAADELDRLRGGLGGRLHEAGWLGRDADGYRNDWTGRHAPALAATSSRTRAAAEALLLQADQQRQASGDVGWTGIGSAVAAAGAVAAAAGRGHLGGQWSDSVRRSAELGVGLGASGRWDVNGAEVDASAEVFGGVRGSAGAGWELADGRFEAGADASVEAGLAASAEAQATAGIVSGAVAGSAFIGGRAEGKVSATIAPDKLAVAAGGSAFIGAQARASAEVEAMGVTGGVGATAYAGAGIEAKAEATITAERIALDVDLGVALGIGVGLDASIEFSPQEAADDIGRAMGWPW